MSSLPKPLGQPWSFIFITINHYILVSLFTLRTLKNQQHDLALENSQEDHLNFGVTIWLTLALFLMMICAGLGSCYLAYIMGQEALKAVTQPEVNSDNTVNQKQPLGGNYKGLKIINEKEILVKVNRRIQDKNNQSQRNQSSSAKNPNLVDYESQPKSVDSKLFPINDSSQGVTLKVSNVKYQGSSLLLDVSLKNESQQSVRFLYSFLNVRDERGKPLSAITEGLPGEIPANSKNFQGTLRIPAILLDDTKTISVSLTNYPEQNLELNLKQIPIAR